ncbi:TPA: phage portal protein, partial [Clostridioides difficile]|nr:phage portal protein [Clostridioides difficile]
KVIQLIDAYDKTQSDTANDFEMFTHAVLVVSGSVVDEEDKKDLNDKYLINFINEEGKADYLIKNIQDTALENYKNRLDNDIHKFSCVPNMSDESFSNNASGVSLAFKLMSLENKVGIKEAKFKKGLMRRIELICDYLKIKKGNEYSYTDIEPVFSRNKPSNEAESAEIMQKLTGILSQETIISLFPSIQDPQEEMEKIDKEKDSLFDDYDFNKISNEIKNKKDNLENVDIKENEDREGSTDVKEK